LAMARSAFWVFFSRILDGLVGGNISLAQAYIADVTTEHERSKGMGILGAAFGFGFILGPAIGGTLVTINPQYPAYAAAVLTLINLIGLIFLPESLPVEKRHCESDRSLFVIITRLLECIRQQRVALILWFRFIYLVVFTMFESGFSYFNIHLSHTAMTSSYLLCFYGLMFAVVQGGGIKSLKKHFSEDKMLSTSLTVLVISYIVYSLVGSMWIQIPTLAVLGVASGLMSTLITTRVSQEVEPSLMGGALGVSAALESMARIVAPPSTGLLIEIVGVGFPFVACALLCLYLIVVEGKIQSTEGPRRRAL